MEKTYLPSEHRYNGQEIKYLRCGKSGIQLPQLSLGLWQNFGAINCFDNSRKMLQYAFDKGITHFDLANNYGTPYGSAEETFGQVMKKDFRPFRHEMFISTKAGYDMWPGPYGEWGSRKYLFNSLHQSLKRMKLDYVDVFYSHRFDPLTPLPETMQALVDIVKQGKALYAGISNYPLQEAQQAYDYLQARDVPCLLHQCRYNLIDRSNEQNGVLQQCADNGVGFIVYSPLAQGMLSGKYLDGSIGADTRMSRDHFLKKDALTPQLVAKLNLLNDIAKQRGESLAKMSVAWLLQNPLVTSVIIGSKNIEQMQETIDATSSPAFTDEQLKALDGITC
jgi:L-glyceraldehyde 3-phosphate reductase